MNEQSTAPPSTKLLLIPLDVLCMIMSGAAEAVHAPPATKQPNPTLNQQTLRAQAADDVAGWPADECER
jgi:hypothetical protein